jgi:hypothetical protein
MEFFIKNIHYVASDQEGVVLVMLIKSLLAASVLSIGAGHGASNVPINQSQSHHVSVSQTENAVSASHMALWQSQNNNKYAKEYAIASQGAAGQGQVSSAIGTQVQSAVTSGPAVLSQSESIGTNLADQQTVGSTQQGQATSTGSSLNQSTVTSKPGQIVQVQIGGTTTVQFQATFMGGPTIQDQLTHNTNVQYSSAITSPK